MVQAVADLAEVAEVAEVAGVVVKGVMNSLRVVEAEARAVEAGAGGGSERGGVEKVVEAEVMQLETEVVIVVRRRYGHNLDSRCRDRRSCTLILARRHRSPRQNSICSCSSMRSAKRLGEIRSRRNRCHTRKSSRSTLPLHL